MIDPTETSPPPLRTVEAIVADGLCMGCGLCQSIAGPDAIRIVMSGEGGERPAVLRPLDEPVLRAINAVCPGVTVEGYRAASEPSEPEIHPIWGPTRQMAIGHAGDEFVRFHASSGGALTALRPASAGGAEGSTSSCTSRARASSRCARCAISASMRRR